MSIILNSLRRLEREKQAAGCDPASLSSLGGPNAMRSTVSGFRVREILLPAASMFLLMVVVAGGLYAFTRSGIRNPKIDRTEIAAVRDRVSGTSGPEAAVRNAVQSLPPPVAERFAAKPEGTVPVHETDIRTLPRNREEFHRFRQRIDPSLQPIPETGGRRISMARPALTAPVRNDTGPGPTPKKNPENTSGEMNKSATAGAARMTDGRLLVQAIVWSTLAEDRMAVVNNRIVHEGELLDGFSIVGIGKDAVYVREENGRLLKVSFGEF